MKLGEEGISLNDLGPRENDPQSNPEELTVPEREGNCKFLSVSVALYSSLNLQ